MTHRQASVGHGSLVEDWWMPLSYDSIIEVANALMAQAVAPAGRGVTVVSATLASALLGVLDLRVHDLRHTAAGVWLGAGADPNVVQRILGHASAAMTMDLSGHPVDQNLWDAAKRIDGLSGGTTGRGAVSRLAPLAPQPPRKCR